MGDIDNESGEGGSEGSRRGEREEGRKEGSGCGSHSQEEAFLLLAPQQITVTLGPGLSFPMQSGEGDAMLQCQHHLEACQIKIFIHINVRNHINRSHLPQWYLKLK